MLEMENVRVLEPDETPRRDLIEQQEEQAPLPEPAWDEYRVRGIATLREALIVARDSLETAEAWARQISVVPVDALPIIKELAHKSRLIVDELKDLR